MRSLLPEPSGQLPTLGQTAKNVKFVDIPKAAHLPAEVNPLAGVEVKR